MNGQILQGGPQNSEALSSARVNLHIDTNSFNLFHKIRGQTFF
jgi:hypothetical protein